MKDRCKKSERQSSVNSSNSSWTEEIFHNALENKGPGYSSPAKESYAPDSRNISFSRITCDRNNISTTDDNSFYSQPRSDLNQNNFIFMPEQQKGFSPSPFSKQSTPLFKMSPTDNQFCFQPPEGVVMPFNLNPVQPAPQIFMNQSTFSQNLRTP